MQVYTTVLETRYPVVKAQHPLEGRRKWRLRVINQFWTSPNDAKQAAYSQSVGSAIIRNVPITFSGQIQATQAEPDDESDFFTDEDLLDEVADDEAPGQGILVRTDFSNEDAWLAFSEKLKEAEHEFSSVDEDEKMAEDAPATASDAQMEEEDGEEESSSHIITVINAPLETRGLFDGISNLTALRLLNDVDLKKVTIPPNTKRIKPQNRLVDLDGWQEIYHGKTLWIYDQKSNVDQCVRLVSQQADFYGTATYAPTFKYDF